MIGADIAPGDDWARIRVAFDSHLADPDGLDGLVEAFAGIPKQDMIGLLIGDLLIHSWDLARSIGADETLPPDVSQAFPDLSAV